MSSQARLRHLNVAALADATPDLFTFFLFLFAFSLFARFQNGYSRRLYSLYPPSSSFIFSLVVVVVSVKCQLEKLIRTPPPPPPRSSAPSPSTSAL